MAARSVTVQLQPGIAQATLPDHRKMVPGVQYEIDWETFTKISNGAKQSVIDVVSINTNSTGNALLADQTSDAHSTLNIFDILSQVSAEPVEYNLTGKGFQGWSVNMGSGASAGNSSTQTVNYTITGPQDERYVYVQNVGSESNRGDVLVWDSEQDRTVTRDHLPNDEVDVIRNVGTFAGITLVDGFNSGYYGWVQVEGENAYVNTTGTVNPGDALLVDPNSPGSAVANSLSTNPFQNTIDITTGVTVQKQIPVFSVALEVGEGTASVSIRSNRAKTPYRRVYNKN